MRESVAPGCASATAFRRSTGLVAAHVARDIVIGHVLGEDRTWLFVKRVHALGERWRVSTRERLADATHVDHLGGTIYGPDAAWMRTLPPKAGLEP